MKTNYYSLFLSLFFIISAANSSSQELVFSPDNWENPAVFEMGQNAPHAFHVPYSSIEDALENDACTSGNFILLNGMWKFKWVERPDLVPENFQDPSYNTKKWDEISVPSSWQMEGYGHPKFRNISLTYEDDAPRIPDYYNPTGCYKRTFKIPAEWTEKEVMLRFEGVKSASYVWINGEKAGYNQGGFEPAEYNITPFLKKGKNDISVEVIRFSDGSYLENQDMWRLSGIFRDVKLYAQPKVFISDFFHTTDLDSEYKNATLKVEAKIENKLPNNISDYTLEIDLLDNAQKSIISNPFLISDIGVPAGTSQVKEGSIQVSDPQKWSAEYPNLYTIVYSLKDQDGKVIEAFSKKIGFREIELDGEVFYMNGVALKLNGVNSHMHHPEFGQTVPLETLKKDLLIMKQHNINSVRTCHYPPTSEYIDMADELGMYIIDEVGDEAHNNIHLSYDSTYTEMYRDRSRKLVYRDRNHASVIIWSAGNESGSGPNVHEVIKTGKEIDSTRPAWMYGGNTFYIPFEDITGPRYWTPYQLKNLAERKILGEADLRPAFMDEYLAATGNGLGGMDEYWELIWKYPRLMGGAIWDWISPGLNTPLWITEDGSSNSNEGAIMGRPLFTEGKSGRGMSFSGHDDWIEFYRDSSLDITGNEISISFWVKPGEIPQPNTFITKGNHQYGIIMNSPESLEFFIQSNSLKSIYQTPYYDNKSTRISASARVSEDWYEKWHHVAGIYDGQNLKLYVDSKEVASEKYEGKIAHSPFPLCIGRDAETHDQGEHAGRMSNMTIDEVRIFNTALPVKDLKNSNLNANCVLALDFETDVKKDDFYAVGLGGRTYGIIWPDRTIQPEIHQVKKSGQPIEVQPINLNKGLLKIVNHHHFKNLSDFDIHWYILGEGEKLDSGSINLDLAAQKEAELKVPYSKLKSPKELILEVSFNLKEANSWAEAGYEVAWEQFIIKEDLIVMNEQASGMIVAKESSTDISISGEHFSYTISKENGLFSTFKFKDQSYFENGPIFNIWRAPLANDIDPWGSYTYSKEKMTDGLGRSIDNQLRSLGMRSFSTEVENIELIQNQENVVQINIEKYYNSQSLRGAFRCLEEYLIYADGSMDLQFHVIPQRLMPDMLPKLGWQLQLPKSYSQIEWYGRGPFETYPDRKTGAKTGIYNSDVDKEYVPYIIPQDHGNHTDVRWLKVENSSDRGLRISAESPLNFSYHKYSDEILSRSMYTYQLKEGEFNTLSLDVEVSGVGGTAIRQLEKYRVKATEKVYRLKIEPY
jgi:beta-galactosidase